MNNTQWWTIFTILVTLPSSSGDDEELSCLVEAFSMVKELLISVDQQVRIGLMYNKGWDVADFELRTHQVISSWPWSCLTDGRSGENPAAERDPGQAGPPGRDASERGWTFQVCRVAPSETCPWGESFMENTRIASQRCTTLEGHSDTVWWWLWCWQDAVLSFVWASALHFFSAVCHCPFFCGSPRLDSA